MSWTFRANNIQFTEFQKAVLSRTPSKDGKKFSLAPGGVGIEGLSVMVDPESPSKSAEVEIHMRFLSKSSHAPIVRFDLYQNTPKPESMKRKCNTHTATGKCTDSILHGVFTALDYYQHTDQQQHLKRN